MPSQAVALLSVGLLIDVEIAPDSAWRAALWRRQAVVPPAVRGTFIVDTGADTTMLREQFMRTLGLQPMSQTRVHTSGSAGQGDVADVYSVDLTLFGNHPQPLHMRAVEVIARPLVHLHAIDGMLGRDLLARVVLIYDGPRKRATITY